MSTANKTDGFYCYSDYLKWDDDKRREIINGKIYMMVPAPSFEHQSISMKIGSIIWHFLKNKKCVVVSAPVDVILADKAEKAENSRNIVQPDILVVCDEKKIQHHGIVGAPDICIEILSPSTAVKDRKEKFELYEKFGVKEYWLVHPEENTVEIFYLDDKGRYGRPDVYVESDKFDCKLLKGLTIDLSQVFTPRKKTPPEELPD